MHTDAVAERSLQRVCDRLPAAAPVMDDGTLHCPFCGPARPLVVRRTILGQLDPVPETGETPHIDGVQLKCAGEGCGFRPDFDVPLTQGHGYWPALDHRAEYERELQRRGGERVADMGYTPGDGQDIEARLAALGYLSDR